MTRRYTSESWATRMMRSYGAVGNGIADDTAAIQAAIDAERAAASGRAARSFYVDATLGNNANPGTQAEPWQTLAKVATSVSSGDTVFLKHGEWEPISTIRGVTYSAY